MRQAVRFGTAIIAAALVSAAFAGCASDEVSDPENEDFLVDGKADGTSITDFTPEACGVLALANESDRGMLDDHVGLDARAAKAIIDYRKGADRKLLTADDERFDSLGELDAVRWVGKSVFHKLLAFAAANGPSCSYPPVDVQLISVSDWHGQLDPTAVPMVGNVGGAPALATYFARERQANPNTLTLTAGDAFGASPPLASFFGEKPAVLAQNAMKFDADGIGNHNFDKGVAHFQEMARLARFPYLSANLANVAANATCPGKPGNACVVPYRIFHVAGAKVAVIGITNPDAPSLVKPGNLGTIRVTEPVAAAQAARAQAAREGAKVFVLIVHMGASGVTMSGDPVGPLLDLAGQLTGFDVILGDHTNITVNREVNGALVVENKSFGLTYARVKLSVDRATGVLAKSAEIVTPNADMVPPDPAVVDLLAPFRTQLAAVYDGKIAVATGLYERGNNIERLNEVPIGNLLADALRTRYGTQIAYTNGGGIRAAIPSSYAPKDLTLRRPAAGYAAGPPFDIVVGDAYAVLPFGNVCVTRTITGLQLWRMLEHSVEALPNANGWFGQISGFRFVYDSSKPVGMRVVSVALDDGTAIAADQNVKLTMVTSDFLDTGGDGYTMLVGSDGVSRDKMADVLLDHMKAKATLEPKIDGRSKDLARP